MKMNKYVNPIGLISLSLILSAPSYADRLNAIGSYAGVAAKGLSLILDSGDKPGSMVGGIMMDTDTSADSFSANNAQVNVNTVVMEESLVGFVKFNGTADLDGTVIDNSTLEANQIHLKDSKVGYMDVNARLSLRGAHIANGSSFRANILEGR